MARSTRPERIGAVRRWQTKLNQTKNLFGATKVEVFAILFMIGATSLISMNSFGIIRSNATSQTQGFNVINAVWGSTGSPTSSAPGDMGDTLTLTLQYIYSATAESVQGYLQLPSGFSLYNGSNVAYAATAGVYPTGATITLSFLVSLSSTLALGSYIIPLDLSWTAAGYAYVLNDTVPVTVRVEGRPQLYFSANGQSLTPDAVNQITVSVSDNGSGSASSIFITASSPTGGILNTIPEVNSLNPGYATLVTVQAFVPSSAAGGIFSLSLAASYEDPYGNVGSASQVLNFYTTSTSTTVYNTTVAINPININVTTGQQSKVIFDIMNTGTSTIYNPTATLGVSSPLVIVSNSTFTFGQAVNTKGSLIFEAMLTASPSATLGTYSGTLSITYSDQQGTQHTQVFTVGFILSGTITITAESESVTQSSRTLAISGSLLNEGTASAYYATAVACVVQTNLTSFSTRTVGSGTGNGTSSNTSTTSTRIVTSFTRNFTGPPNGFPGGFTVGGATLTSCPSSATSTYVGEIDPNSPVAFTANAAYTPSNSSSAAIVVLVITFKNAYGISASQPVDKQVTLTSASGSSTFISPTGSSQGKGHEYVQITLYGVIVGVAVAAIAGGVYVRRSKNSGSDKEDKVV